MPCILVNIVNSTYACRSPVTKIQVHSTADPGLRKPLANGSCVYVVD